MSGLAAGSDRSIVWREVDPNARAGYVRGLNPSKGGLVAYCVIVDNPKGSAELYEQVTKRVAAGGEMPPQGAIFQVAGPAEGGWRVISVWESREAQERFRDERLVPAFTELGISRDDVSWSDFDVHSFMAGDLSGAAQPG